MTPKRIRKKRKCGHCKAVLTTNAAGLVAHSMERHGTASPPRPESKGSGGAFSGMGMAELLAKFMFGSKRRQV